MVHRMLLMGAFGLALTAAFPLGAQSACQAALAADADRSACTAPAYAVDASHSADPGQSISVAHLAPMRAADVNVAPVEPVRAIGVRGQGGQIASVPSTEAPTKNTYEYQPLNGSQDALISLSQDVLHAPHDGVRNLSLGLEF